MDRSLRLRRWVLPVAGVASLVAGMLVAVPSAYASVTVPEAPTGVVATPGNGSAVVKWTAPVHNGGSPITGYLATATPGSKTCTSTGPTIKTCTIHSLTNGTPYSVSVKARNAKGLGAASPHVLVKPGVPLAPTGVNAMAANAEATVRWNAPPNNGSTITRYTVTSNPGSKTCTARGTASCIVTGLTNGDGYTFSVTATNAIGTGAASSASSPVTPATIPGTPTGVTATSGNAQATVTWNDPSDGGSFIDGYVIAPSSGSPVTVDNGAATSYIFSGLTNGEGYTFTVTAINAIGTGAASSASSSVTPATIPGAPSGVMATAGNASASVSFSAPVNNGGAAITSYAVTAIDSTDPAGDRTLSGTSSPMTVSDLTNGDTYTFDVTASNSIGTGAPSGASAPVSLELEINGCIVLEGADLAGCNLTGADLSNFDLTDATLFGANLTGVSLTNANLTNVISGGIVGTPASLPTHWSLNGGYLVGPGGNLPGADLPQADLYSAYLENVDLSGADLYQVDFGYADLSNANLSNADLEQGGLGASNLAGTNLAGADLTNAGLRGATLPGANLSGANLSGANLELVSSGGIVGTPSTLPTNWELVDRYLIGEHANLNGANLSGANLSGLDVSYVHLSHADLSGVDLAGADIFGTDLTSTNLNNVTWSNTTCPDGTNSNNDANTCANNLMPSNWELYDIYLIRPGANLSQADLYSAYLESVDLSGADLYQVNFGYADLSNADLSNADLEQAGLGASNLTGTNLSGADLTNADLYNATVSGTNLTAVTWSNTICPDGTNSDNDGNTCIDNLTP